MPIRQALYEWLSSVVSTTVWADQNEPIQTRPHAVLKINSISREGWPTRFPLNAAGEQPVAIGLGLNVSVNTYANGVGSALDMLSDVVASLERTQTLISLRSLGVAFTGLLSAPKDLSAISGTEFESRAQADFRFAAHSHQLDPVGWIELVELTKQIYGPQADPIIEETRIVGVA